MMVQKSVDGLLCAPKSTAVAQVRHILNTGLRDLTDVYGALEFGSAARNKPKPNDYDVIVVTKNHDFLIPRESYRSLSELVLRVYKETNMRVEMLVRDQSILSTFYSNFGRTFKRHLDDYGCVICGSDPRPLFTNSFSDAIAGFVGKVPDFGLFVEALEWEVHRLSSTRKHATMLGVYLFNQDQGSFGKAMSKLKMMEHSRNVLELNGVHLRYEDSEGILGMMGRLYGPGISAEVRRIETLREREMAPEDKVGLFFDALELRERVARKLVSDLSPLLRQRLD
jgi:hypothetical protein